MIDKRFSGLLLHLTSLPSRYGLGDMGPEAYKFIDFLYDTGTKCWQILPLNPTFEEFFYSPYSSLSAFAGNTMLISPDILHREGLLEESDLHLVHEHHHNGKVNFKLAEEIKKPLLEKAWQNFTEQNGSENSDYKAFCKEHNLWLEDYALFVALLDKHHGHSWADWDKPLRDREKDALAKAKEELSEAIEKEKFLQFIFFRQWNMLRAYSKEKEVLLFGDLPFYLNFNSADTWSFPQYFKLNKAKKPTLVSGVPPDYYSKTGQLWGTPVFNWKKLKEDDFKWWVHRIMHNFKLFDLLRLDHFRAFSACWEVPAKDDTAMYGKWTKVPGEELFSILEKKKVTEKIIAEDLGDIDQPVRDLMAKFNFPGMRVLQFAFFENEKGNEHLPYFHHHNCVVYTGTHDNNTIKGWIKNEIDDQVINKIEKYTGRHITEHNIAIETIRLCLSSVANLAIIPVQDLLDLDQDAMMNRPGTTKGNWQWQLSPHQLNNHHKDLMNFLNEIFWRNKSRI